MQPEVSLQERAAQSAAPSSNRQEGFALCLSGGGYRAALFHLGALRRLHELKLFPQIRAISLVSGGSIMAAFLAEVLIAGGTTLAQGFPDWQRQVADPFHRLAARDIRTWPFLLNLPWITASIDDLGHSVERAASTLNNSIGLLESSLGHLSEAGNRHHEERMVLASDNTERMRQAMEMLDNIQRHRLPPSI